MDVMALPKAELHVHIEGTFEPELMFAVANAIASRSTYPNIEGLRAAYEFADLQSFLNVYYAGMEALARAQDYYDFTTAYLRRALRKVWRHAEIFFDPQAHTSRGGPFQVVVEGIGRALADGRARSRHHDRISLCASCAILRAESAMATLESARTPGSGSSPLDSTPRKWDNPP